jgi:predicted transposase/invertase (TIGR01784 family)
MEQKNGANEMKTRFINPYTDFGFKKLFGEEANKDLLIDFLNELLPIPNKIINLSFKNTEYQGVIAADRRAIFDLHCEDEKGARFIVEMQKAKIKYFKERAVFYTTFPVREQSEKGEWDFQLNPIYCVAIVDFTFDDEREQKSYISNVLLKDQYCQVFYDKLMYIFVEMPRFTKEEKELTAHFDKWLYFLKNLESISDIPDILNEKVFLKGFEIAEIANFSTEQLAQYEESLKIYRDLKGVVDTSYEEGKEDGITIGKEQGITIGKEQGLVEGKTEMARMMKKKNYPIDEIIEITGLTHPEIEEL